MTAELTVSSLHIYPVKSMRGADLEHTRVEKRGLADDRRWMVIDEDGRLVTQREHAFMARISVAPTADGLSLSVEGRGSVDAAFPPENERATATVWRDDVDAAIADAGVNAWLSDYLDQSVRLAYMDAVSTRETAEKWGEQRPVSFADSFPILITTEASLNALNTDIAAAGGDAVAMSRFRPNIVLRGGEPWREDGWARLRIGGVEIDLVKPCDRCVMTTLDPSSGAALGKEPLKTLAKSRISADERVSGVLFGWNSSPRDEGEIAIGDPVEVVAERETPWPLTGA